MIILGIDPGTLKTGYGLVEKKAQGIRHIDNGLIVPLSKQAAALKLKNIFEAISKLIQTHAPQAIALEDVFISKNVRSSLKLGQAKGVIMLAAALGGIPVFEYSPAEIKKTISNFGQATKEQMQKMVRIHLKLKEAAFEDASDALAVALCHCQTQNYRLYGKQR